jgi:hypothetical protein
MLRLTEDFQLEISCVYKTRTSSTQARDMAELVLFYTHLALGAGYKFSQKPQRRPEHGHVPGVKVVVLDPACLETQQALEECTADGGQSLSGSAHMRLTRRR